MKKSILGISFAFAMLFSMQNFKQQSEAHVGSWLARKATKNVNLQRAGSYVAGAAGAAAGRWAVGEIGAAIGTAIAPGIGTVVGGAIGVL